MIKKRFLQLSTNLKLFYTIHLNYIITMDRKKILQLAVVISLIVGMTAISSANQEDVSGGDVSQVELADETETTKWAGFYGEITETAVLSDASDNVFFEWTAEETIQEDRKVFAVDSESEWSGGDDYFGENDLSGAESLIDDYFNDTDYTTGTDSVSNTYDVDGDFEGTTTVYAVTETNDQTDSESFLLDSVDGSQGDPIFATIAEAAGFDAFDGSEGVNYQLLTAAEESTTYDFYVELS